MLLCASTFFICVRVPFLSFSFPDSLVPAELPHLALSPTSPSASSTRSFGDAQTRQKQWRSGCGKGDRLEAVCRDLARSTTAHGRGSDKGCLGLVCSVHQLPLPCHACAWPALQSGRAGQCRGAVVLAEPLLCQEKECSPHMLCVLPRGLSCIPQWVRVAVLPQTGLAPALAEPEPAVACPLLLVNLPSALSRQCVH